MIHGRPAGGESSNGAVVRPLRVLLSTGPMAGPSDQQLLERFLEADRDEAELALAAIVHRHGPMVHRVCHQTMGDGPSQDGFRSPSSSWREKPSVRRRMSIASWLHGVAYRVCLFAERPTSAGDDENGPPRLRRVPSFAMRGQATASN